MQLKAKFYIPPFLSPYAGLPRGIYALFLAQIINSAGNFVTPFLTLMLSEKLGMRSDQAGFFVMISLLVQMPGVVIGGKLADHVGRKAILITAQTVSALFILSCAFIQDIHWLPWLLIGSSIFNGTVKPATNALTADLTDAANRRIAFSLTYLGINLGYAIGPMMAGFLFHAHIRWLFIGDALTTLIAVALVQVMVKEDFSFKQTPKAAVIPDADFIHPDERAEKGSFLLIMGRRPYLSAMILLLTVYSFIYNQHSFTVSLDLAHKFGPSGPAFFGTLEMVNALVVVFCSTVIVWLTRKMRSLECIALAGLLYGCGFGLYFFTQSLFGFIIGTIIWSVGEVLTATNNGTYIACHAPISHRARFTALQTLCQGTGSCLGPLLMGKYITGHGIDAVWVLVFFISVAAGILMYTVSLLEKKHCPIQS